MIYLYVELRYQRQLNRICPDVLDAFFSALAASVRKNGGLEIRVPTGVLYGFSENSVGYLFAASRVIGDLRALLEEHRTRIREYLIFVEYTDRQLTSDSFPEYRTSWETIITPDEGILLTRAALGRLDAYLSSVALPGSDLSVYSGPKNSGQREERLSSEPAVPPEVPDAFTGGRTLPCALSLYVDRETDAISSFRALSSQCALAEPESWLGSEDLVAFSETKSALDMYSRLRFTRGQPEFRIEACVEHLALSFRLSRAAAGAPIPVTVYGSQAIPDEMASLMDKLAESCIFSRPVKPVFLPAELASIPGDLLELAYLIYLADRYLFPDEMAGFFEYLGKQADFMKALGVWLHSCGILANACDLASLDRAKLPEIIGLIGDRRAGLDRQFAGFLWNLYEKGMLLPVFDFHAVLASLGCQVPDSFLVSCLYNSEDIPGDLERIRPSFANPLVADAVARMETARAKYDSGAFDEAGAITKDVLHLFQKEKIVPGEYRALSLVAMLSLARNNGDDAVVYLEYALENAERLHDSRAMLATRLDMAIVYFIIGNFHFALCSLDITEKIIGTCYAKDWEVLLYFMRGRIAFELGDYRNAEVLFQTAASLASVSQIPEAVSLCRVWYARALIHQNRFASAENILIGCVESIPEAWIFLIESGLVSGRKVNGVVFPETIPSTAAQTAGKNTGSFSWRSGFALAEDRSYGTTSGVRVAVQMYETFLGYYRARFGEDPSIPDAVSRLSATARSALDTRNPYAAIYYYFCFDLGSRCPQVLPADTAGFLSRGFKYIQKRANEIDDNNLREQYMQTPTWNSRLYRSARENMLI